MELSHERPSEAPAKIIRIRGKQRGSKRGTCLASELVTGGVHRRCPTRPPPGLVVVYVDILGFVRPACGKDRA